MFKRPRSLIVALLMMLFCLAALPALADDSKKEEPAAPAKTEASPKQSQNSDKSLRPRLSVIGVGLDAKAMRTAAYLVRQAESSARATSRFDFVSAVELLDAENIKASGEKAMKAGRLIEQARRSYDDLELEDARKSAEEAIALLNESDLSGRFSMFINAQKLLIATLLADSEMKRANDLLHGLLPLDPEARFDPNLFSPDYIAQVRKMREELDKEKPQALDLVAAPEPALVYIDGRFRGVTPIEMHDLAPGDHMMTLIAPGYARTQRMVTPAAAGTVTEKMTPTSKGTQYAPLMTTLRGKFMTEERNDAALGMAKFLGIDQLAVVAVRTLGGNEFSATLYRVDAKDGHELANAESVFTEDARTLDEGADSFLAPLFAVDQPRGSDGKAVRAVVNPFKWRKRHTGFVLYGVAAAALGTGIGFGLDAKSQAQTFKDLTAPQNSPVYDRVEKVGKRSAILADVSYGVALAAAVTATVLVIHDYLSDRAMAAGVAPVPSGSSKKESASSSTASDFDDADDSEDEGGSGSSRSSGSSDEGGGDHGDEEVHGREDQGSSWDSDW